MENQTIQNPTKEEIPNQPKKRFPVLSLVLIIISVLLLFFTAFLVYQNMQLQKQISSLQVTPSVASQPAIDSTANWKIYADPLYKFSIRYPLDMVIENVDFAPDIYKSFMLFKNEKDQFSIYIRESTLQDEVEQIRAQTEGHVVTTLIKNESFLVDGITSKLLEYTSEDKNDNRSTLVIPSKKNVIVINAQSDIFDQILSTFKFLDSPKNTVTVKLYYHDSKLDPNGDFCEANNYIEKDMPKTNTPIKDAINTLIRSDVFEKDDRFILKGINLKQDGTLILEFPLIEGFTTGGSCRIGILTSQIEKTALQFSEVKKVTFEPEVFQP